MLFWRMDKKLTMINFQHSRTNQALEVILISQYINMDGSGMVYNIGGDHDVVNIQRNLMV